MTKPAQTELHRLFLIERLPEPLTRASSHLQLFDNYIENTRMRIRSIRDPYLKTWTRILQQRFPFVRLSAFAEEVGFKSAVPKLIEIASTPLRDGEYFDLGNGYVSIRTSALATALILTKQEPREFDLVHQDDHYGWTALSQQKEDKSVDRLKQWWNAHSPEYLARTIN